MGVSTAAGSARPEPHSSTVRDASRDREGFCPLSGMKLFAIKENEGAERVGFRRMPRPRLPGPASTGLDLGAEPPGRAGGPPGHGRRAGTCSKRMARARDRDPKPTTMVISTTPAVGRDVITRRIRGRCSASATAQLSRSICARTRSVAAAGKLLGRAEARQDLDEHLSELPAATRRSARPPGPGRAVPGRPPATAARGLACRRCGRAARLRRPGALPAVARAGRDGVPGHHRFAGSGCFAAAAAAHGCGRARRGRPASGVRRRACGAVGLAVVGRPPVRHRDKPQPGPGRLSAPPRHGLYRQRPPWRRRSRYRTPPAGRPAQP